MARSHHGGMPRAQSAASSLNASLNGSLNRTAGASSLPRLNSSAGFGGKGRQVGSPPATASTTVPGWSPQSSSPASRQSLHGGIVGAGLGGGGFAEDPFCMPDERWLGKTLLPAGHSKRNSLADTLQVTGSGALNRTMPRPDSATALPALPPAFSRPLSPKPQQQAQHLQQVLESVQSSQAPSLELGQQAIPQSYFPVDDHMFGSPLQSSRAPMPRRQVWKGSSATQPQADPFLRVVPLGQWLQELGLINDNPRATFPMRQRSAQQLDYENMLVTGRSWNGFATDPGAGTAKERAKLDRAFVEHLAMLAKTRMLPLPELGEDLQIWRLKLHDRTARKRLADLFGRHMLKKKPGLDDFGLRRRPGEDDEDASGKDKRSAGYKPSGYDSADLFGDTGGGSSASRNIGGGGGGYRPPAGRSVAPSSGKTDQIGKPEDDGTDADGAKAREASQKDLDDEEERKRRLRRQQKEGEDDANSREKTDDKDNRPQIEGAHGESDLQQTDPHGKGRDQGNFNLDSGDMKATDFEAEEPPPRGLFRIKDPGARPSSEGGTLFPSLRRGRKRGDGGEEDEDEEEEEEIEEPSPPATAPLPTKRKEFRSNLQQEFREAIRVAWERALAEVEERWTAQQGGSVTRSLMLESDVEPSELASPEGKLSEEASVDELNTEAVKLASPPDDGLGDISKPSVTSVSLMDSGEFTEEASGNRTSSEDGFFNSMSRGDDLSESTKKLRRQRYRRYLQAGARDGLSRSRARQCWKQRVEFCRRSLGSLSALGTFAEGATGSLRLAVASR